MSGRTSLPGELVPVTVPLSFTLDGTNRPAYANNSLAIRRSNLVVYWLLFAFFALGASIEQPFRMQGKSTLILTAGAIVLATLIGLRYGVGSDWVPYAAMYRRAGILSLESVLRQTDPGYQLLNWSVQQVGLGLWAVNIICGTIFSWGLLRFCRNQPLPWLAFAAAISYLGIVVAMGYTRQAVALGIILAGLAAVEKGASGLRFATYVAVAALFHRTAVMVLPLVAFSSERTRLLNFLVAVAVVVLAYDLFLSSSLTWFFSLYLDTEMSSQGAAIRVALVTIPAVVFLFNRKRFDFPVREDRIWRNFALAALVALVALFTVRSTTAVDRVSLYLLPLEIVILARIPLAFRSPIFAKLAVIALSGAILSVWMTFAVNAQYWLPYRLFPIGERINLTTRPH